MDAETLLSLLGARSDDPAVEEAFCELRTRRRPFLDPENIDASIDWVLVRRQGVEFGFVDEVYFEAGPYWKRRRSGVPMILFQVYFYSGRENVRPFAGVLPFRIEWSDNRETVRRKMASRGFPSRFHLKDVWHAPEFRMTVVYKDDGKSVGDIVCQQDLKPWSESGRKQPPINTHDWLSLFGLPPNSSVLTSRLRPLSVAARLEEGTDEGEAEFRTECGLELLFTRKRFLTVNSHRVARSTVTPHLGAVRFFRRREWEAREWTGELPFNLSFDDSQPVLVEKIGRRPDEQQDDDFEGFARWSFPDFGLHVTYDNMKNYLVRLILMAPHFR